MGMERWSNGVLECWSIGVLECWSLNIGHHYSALRLSGIELRNKRIAMEQTGQGIHGTNSIFAGR